MAVGSIKEFTEVLKASQLFDAEQLTAIIEKHSTEDPKLLAGKLAQDGTLTRWQAKMIYAGYPKIKLGNYVLLDRIARDDLGDRFEATHVSLDRKVEIQVLPKRISDDAKLENYFVSNIGLVSELDHPHITHIHDVDRAGGQYFLVDEAQQGVSLDQVELTADGLLLCCNQIIQALAHAHSQGVVHGEVDLVNIVYANVGQFKVRGISLSLIRRKLSGSDDPTARDDYIALVNLLTRKFQALELGQRQKIEWLGNQLEQLRENPITEYPRVLQTTQQWIDSWGEASPPFTLEELKTHPVSSTATTAESLTASLSSPELEQAPSRKPANTNPSRESSDLDDAPVENNGRQRILIGGLVLCLLFLILGAPYALGILVGKFAVPPLKEENRMTRQTSSITPSPAPESSVRDLESSSNNSNKNDDSSKNSEDQSKPDKTPKPAVDDKPQPNEPPTTVVNKPPAKEPDTTDQAVGDVDPNPDPMANNTNQQDDQTPPDQPSGPTPFEEIPSMVDLPTTDFKESFLIGQLGEADKLTSVELIAQPSAFSNGKGGFSIQEIDKTNWEVKLLNNSGGGETVARIELTDQSLRFTWMEEVSKKSKANAIRNGILRLNGEDATKDVVLREPVALDLKLSADAYSSKNNTDATWLPQTSSIRVEVKKPTAPWPNQLFLGDGTAFPETYVFDENRTPLIILFSADETKQFLSIVVTPKINRKLSFDVGVFARGKNTDPVQYKSAKSAEETIEFLTNARETQAAVKTRAQAALDQARQIRNGTIGKREEDLKAAKKVFDELDDNLDISEQIRDQLAGLHEASLQVSVYYELEGRRIVLAESRQSTDQ